MRGPVVKRSVRKWPVIQRSLVEAKNTFHCVNRIQHELVSTVDSNISGVRVARKLGGVSPAFHEYCIVYLPFNATLASPTNARRQGL